VDTRLRVDAPVTCVVYSAGAGKVN
jgi:hypothetical protein